MYSQTSIVRGGRGYQISKNFPRITEVRVVKRSIKFWHPFTAKVIDTGFGERTAYLSYLSSPLYQKMLTWLHNAQAVVFNLDMNGIFLNPTLNLTISSHLQYFLKLKSAHWQIIWLVFKFLRLTFEMPCEFILHFIVKVSSMRS